MSEENRPAWAKRSDLESEYYDSEWGMPVLDEAGVYERLVLEGFQAGLSWVVVLRKREALREAFCGFDPEKVAEFGEEDVERLLGDERLLRNRQKVLAAITNARATVALREAEDLPDEPAAAAPGLARLVWSYRPHLAPPPPGMDELPGSTSEESKALAKDLKRRGFTFVGPVTMYALMQAIGIVNDHPEGSPRRAACEKAVAKALKAGKRTGNSGGRGGAAPGEGAPPKVNPGKRRGTSGEGGAASVLGALPEESRGKRAGGRTRAARTPA